MILRNLFLPSAVVAGLTALEPIKSTVMDRAFRRRPTLPSPIVGTDDLLQEIHEMPVTPRGAASIAVGGDALSLAFYEPLPVNGHVNVTGKSLVDLRALTGVSLILWRNQQLDYLRKVCRKTTEAIAAISLRGSIDWPVKLEGGGFARYRVNFGAPLSHVPDKKWDADDAKLKDAYLCLSAMHERLQNYGYGGDMVIWAGKNAYSALYALAEAMTSTAKMLIAIEKAGINIGGYMVERMTETYRNPETEVAVPKVGDDEIVMVGLDADMPLFYCALDDLDAQLQALPFYAKPIEKKNPSGYEILGMSKPFPVPKVRAICWATVTGA